MKDAIIYDSGIFAYQEILSLVEKLNTNKINTVVISTNTNFFPVAIVDERESSAFDCLLDAIKILKTDPSSCVVYDFTQNNITKSKNFGFFTVGLNKNSDRIVDSPSSFDCMRGLFINTPSSAKDCDLIIFDAGNVLIYDIDCMPSILSEYNVKEKDRNEIIKDYFDYEAPLDSGNMSTMSYWKHIEKDFGIKVKGDPFEKHFCPRINPEMQEIVKRVLKSGRKAVLGSNTFAPHMIKIRETGALDLLSDIYTSYEMGYYKPQKSFFEAILKAEGVDPCRAYFIDDCLSNVLAASDVGLKTMHYCGENRNDRLFKVFDF